MIRKELPPPTEKTIRQFVWVQLIGFGLLGALLYARNRPLWSFMLWAGSVAVAFISLASLPAGKFFYKWWMKIGMAIGFVMSHVVITVIFYLLITPVALFFRLKGRDELGRKKGNRTTYWTEHPKITDPDYYKHLY